MRGGERGVALGLALVALVVVGACIAGALFSGTQEQRVADNVRRVQAAFGVAELGAYDVIRGWGTPANMLRYNGLYPYPSSNRSSTLAIARHTDTTGTGSYSGTLSKLNDALYLIDITGRDTMSLAGRIRGGGASQRIALLARIQPLHLPARAALTAGGASAVAATATIDGADHTPPAWLGCGPLDSTRAGLRIQDGASVTLTGQPDVTGDPPVLPDSTVAESTFSRFGDVTYDALAQRATIGFAGDQNLANGIAPRALDGRCDTGDTHNWGSPTAPTGPCGDYFPVIHIAGNATITGGEGQGVLLVDGSLSVQGGFQFFGLVIVKGSLAAAGEGNDRARLWGMVMVQHATGASPATTTIAGAAQVLYSKCSVLKALDKSGTAVMVRSRGWMQLFQTDLSSFQ